MADLSDLATYVVTVRSFKDRRSHIRAQAERYNLKLQFIWGYDADKFSTQDFAGVDWSSQTLMVTSLELLSSGLKFIRAHPAKMLMSTNWIIKQVV